MVNIGIVGCGWIAEKAHIPAISKSNDANIVAVYDVNNAGEKISAQHGFTNYLNMEEFLEAPFDAVIIATPNNTHSYYTDLALSHNKHVLCEKPIALSTNSYLKSLELSKQKNKIMMPAFVNRFRGDIMQLHKLVSENAIGDIEGIEAKWVRKSGIPRPGTWITRKELSGGGVLVDLGSHLIDICLMLFSSKQIVDCKLSLDCHENVIEQCANWCQNFDEQKLLVDVETVASGNLVLNNNKTIDFRVSWADDIKGDITRILVHGTKGDILLETLFGFSNLGLSNEIHLYVNNNQKRHYGYSNNNCASLAFENMAEYWIKVINGQKMSYLKPEDGLYAVDAIERLYKSLSKEKED